MAASFSWLNRYRAFAYCFATNLSMVLVRGNFDDLDDDRGRDDGDNKDGEKAKGCLELLGTHRRGG